MTLKSHHNNSYDQKLEGNSCQTDRFLLISNLEIQKVQIFQNNDKKLIFFRLIFYNSKDGTRVQEADIINQS